MPFVRPGGDLKLKRSLATGRFDFEWDITGNPTFVDTGEHAVMSLLLEHRGRWWADTTGNRGSRLYTLKNLKKRTPSDVKAYAEEALAPLIESGYLSEPPVVTAVRVGSKLILNVSARRPGQQPTISRVALTWS